MFLVAGLVLLAVVEIRGRGFYRHLAFIASYYRSKPRVLSITTIALAVGQKSRGNSWSSNRIVIKKLSS